MKARLPKWRLFTVFALLTLLLSGCGKPYLSALAPAGEVAQSQYDLMILSTVIMIVVIIAVIAIYLIAIFRFRRKKGDENKIPKQVEGNHVLEIIWTVVPILLLLILAVPTVTSVFKLADTSVADKKNKDGGHDALVINVRANLYWWEFEYPDQKVITSQDLVVPTDQKVYFKIHSSDVKHSFWIPSAGGKMDTNVDGINEFWLEFDGDKSKKAGGVFYGKCAELCGPSHALMDFKVKALPENEFNQWMDDMKNAKEDMPTTASAQQGQEIFKQNCISCHAVSPKDPRPEQARVAPNLATFGEREKLAGVLDHNKENIKKWVHNPQEFKPGNKMPSFSKLDDQQLDALADYLMGLKVQD